MIVPRISFITFGKTRILGAQIIALSKYLTRSHTNSSFRSISSQDEGSKDLSAKDAQRKAGISKAMRAYLQRSVEHDKFMTEKITEYEIGKRHLANMMGENPETFTQEDINNAIAYLLPSGLFSSHAHPVMKHPLELFAKRKAAEFDESGRPFHSLFYTGRPAYYSLLQKLSSKAQGLDNLAAALKGSSIDQQLNVEGSKWITKEKFENIVMEVVPDNLFTHFISSMERLINHPLSYKEEKFIMEYRENIGSMLAAEDIPELMYTEKGIPHMIAKGTRKTAQADVTVYGQGSGKITINGEDILYFDSVQDREQVMFPLQLTGLLGTVDIEATVEAGGKSGQAGAIRYGVSLALRSFVSQTMVEKMRIAGLLTKDARKKERKKPGRRRARARYTWKKR